MIALILNQDKRILSTAPDECVAAHYPRVETLPEGKITDYKYIEGEFIYEPLPQMEEPEPVPTMIDELEAQALYTAVMTDTLL